MAVTRADPSDTDEYRLLDDELNHWPVQKFYEENDQSDNRRFIQCPRCRDILLVKIKGVNPTNDSDCSDGCCSDCEAERRENKETSKTARSVSVHVPSIMVKCLLLGRKRGGATLLWRVSLLHPNFMSFEALGGDSDKDMIDRLAGYGVIEKAPGERNKSVYRIDKENQAKLIDLFHLDNPSGTDKAQQYKLLMELSVDLWYAAWRHMKDEHRIDRSLRSLNRFFFLSFLFSGILPPLPLSWRQELVVTALVLFFTTLAAQFLCITMVYALFFVGVVATLAAQFSCIMMVYALFFVGVGQSLSSLLNRSNNVKSCWWQVPLVSYVLYMLCKFFCGNRYLSWAILVYPKVTFPAVKWVWG
jgi:hypothetical protein